MNDHEICTILAEFEFDQKVEVTGNHIRKFNFSKDDWINGTHELGSRYYLDDLNTLIPIWKKLQNFGISLRFDQGDNSMEHGYFLIDSLGDEYGRNLPEGTNLQYRLAKATALAIIELGDKKCA